MRASTFFDSGKVAAKKPTPHQPIPKYVESRVKIKKERARAVLANDFETTCQDLEKSSEKSMEPLKQARKLPKEYELRKALNTGFMQKAADCLPKFFSSKETRHSQIEFFTSIVNHLTTPAPTPATIKGMRALAMQIDSREPIINGAYIFIAGEIEKSYLTARWSKDPKASQLFVALSSRIENQTTAEKIEYLTALHRYLQPKELHPKIKFGPGETAESVLSKIQAQIDELSLTTSIGLK